MNNDVELVTLLVEVHKDPNNEVEGTAWKPSPRVVAAEIQERLIAFDPDDGYRYSIVQVWPSDEEADPDMLATEGGVIVDFMIRYDRANPARPTNASWEEIVRRVRYAQGRLSEMIPEPGHE